jgi:hypothetical protein
MAYTRGAHFERRASPGGARTFFGGCAPVRCKNDPLPFGPPGVRDDRLIFVRYIGRTRFPSTLGLEDWFS